MKCRNLAAAAAVATGAALVLAGPPARGDTTTFAAGTVGVTGLAAGATVTVYAWPSTTTGAALADDSAVDTVILGTTTASADGIAAVDAADSAKQPLPSADIEPNGSTMYEVDVDDGDGDGIRSWFGDSDQLPDTGLTPADFSSTAPPAGEASLTCAYAGGWSAYGWSYNHLEHYIIAYGRPNAPEDVHIWDGAQHAIQMGFDVGYGVWTATASATMESTQNAGATQAWGYPKNVFNKVDFHLYHRPCWDHVPCRNCGGLDPPDFWQHEGRAEVFADFYSVVNGADDPPASIHWCYPHSPGYTFFKTEGDNETFDLGTSLFGVGLSVHAAYQHEDTAYWGPLTADVNLCGTWRGGIVKSSLVAARPA